MRERGLDDDARRALREAEAAPRLEALELWLARMRPTVLDKSPMAKAIDYARSNWEALVRLKQGGDPAALTPHAWKERYADELVQDRAWVLARLRGKDAAAQ